MGSRVTVSPVSLLSQPPSITSWADGKTTHSTSTWNEGYMGKSRKMHNWEQVYCKTMGYFDGTVLMPTLSNMVSHLCTARKKIG